MAYSLESRAPWLDHRLAELAGSLPPGFKLHGRGGKFVFKAGMAPHLPEPVVNRRKMGFAVSLVEWFRSSLRPVFVDAVLGTHAVDYLDPDSVRRLWAEHQSGLHDHGRKLWTLLTFALWDLHHGEGFDVLDDLDESTHHPIGTQTLT